MKNYDIDIQSSHWHISLSATVVCGMWHRKWCLGSTVRGQAKWQLQVAKQTTS